MKKIDKVIKESISNFVKQLISETNTIYDKYECINESNSWASAMNKGARGANGLVIEYNSSKTVYGTLNEDIDWETEDNEKGGIIVFSTDVNAVKMSENKFINWLKQKMTTIANRINATKKIDKIAVNNELVGWTVGHYLDGRYTAKNGKQYGENSLSVMVVGITFEKLIKVAEELSASFNQESVLVKDFESNRILFVKP